MITHTGAGKRLRGPSGGPQRNNRPHQRFSYGAGGCFRFMAALTRQGKSVNGFINRAIAEAMERDREGGTRIE